MIPEHVWIFDENRRVYLNKTGGPSYRHHWYKQEISGESKSCWILSNGKMVKKTHAITDDKKVENIIFIHENSYKIAQEVNNCGDADKLRAIMEILNPPNVKDHRAGKLQPASTNDLNPAPVHRLVGRIHFDQGKAF